jgi:hypothetical protein
MDKDRLKRLCEIIIETSYGDVTISEFNVVPTFKLDNELSKWVPDSFTLFIRVKSSGSSEFTRNIQSKLEGCIGIECCVDFD